MKTGIKYLPVLVILIMVAAAKAAPPNGLAVMFNLITSDTLSFNEYKGKVVDAKTGEPLSFATITVEGENTATVSNNEGNFILKISKKSKPQNIIISYLGYKNLIFSISDLTKKKNILSLEESVITLKEIVITPGPVYDIILKVMNNIENNYSDIPYQMTGFYRESVQKKNNYVSLAEAIVNIYKTAYRSALNDQVQILKGRTGMNVKKMDTLLFKLQGGPGTGLLLDIVKNRDLLLNREMLDKYKFKLIGEIMLDGKLNYIIAFDPINENEVLYSGKFYVDVNRYALTAADFHLNLNDPRAASEIFIRKKPIGVTVTPTFTHYIVKYHEQDGKWYFNYAKGEVKFKVKWRRKLFATHYTTKLEIAITDRSHENATRFKASERFKENQVLTETLAAFTDENYWGKYNYIEPDQSIEVTINKFKKLLQK